MGIRCKNLAKDLKRENEKCLSCIISRKDPKHQKNSSDIALFRYGVTSMQSTIPA